MADQCIVCLQDLASGDPTAHGHSDAAEPEHLLRGPDQQLSSSPASGKTVPIQNHPDTVAHLLPCGHDLHHECLKPWVERANSCPICRQNFNEVELRDNICGPCLYTYAVEDKRQVADLDPTIVLEDDLFEEPLTEPCLLCGTSNDEDVLMLCDGCNGSSHTYCAGLESVPSGSWFCHFCQEDGTANAGANRSRPRATRIRAQRRPNASRRSQSPDAWAQVWQSVWHTFNFDLDFPYDEDEEVSTDSGAEIERARRREYDAWQHRRRVAESQGGAVRFQDTASTLLLGHARAAPRPESQEELRAWNAFDKARAVDANGAGAGRRRNKRRSPTASPVEPEVQPERILKRPRTKRNQDAAERPSASIVESYEQPARAPIDRTGPTTNPNDGRSFFHSLLREVEAVPTTPSARATPDPATMPAPALSPKSDTPSSPASSSPTSPAMSARSTSRSRSASPSRLQLPRPSSPPLTSSVLPVFPQSPTYAPHAPANGSKRPSPAPPDSDSNTTSQANSHRSPPSSTQTKLDRVRSRKAEVQALVAAALKPSYRSGKLGTEQYTEINRSISRKLYEQIVESEGLINDDAKRKLQNLAEVEVAEAMSRLGDSATNA